MRPSILVGRVWAARTGRHGPPARHQTGNLWAVGAVNDLAIVVPYFNPGPGARANVEEIIAGLERTGCSFEVITVSDGSTDDSAAAVAEIEDERVHHVVLPVNEGKGAALRVGMAAGRGNYVGFIDADGEISVDVFRQFADALQGDPAPDVILASKRHPQSQVGYPFVRRLYSWGYHQLVRSLFRLDVQETQTGAKLVRRDVLAAALPRMLEKRFAFDLELLVVARRLGYREFVEVPVVIQHRFASTVSWRSVCGVMLDTLAIFYRLHLLRWYDD